MNEIDKVASALAGIESQSKHPAYGTAFQIHGLLNALNEGPSDEQPHVLFHGLCLLAEQAFPDRTPTDADIVTNPATPELMRYLLASLRRYRSRISGATPSSAHRYKTIANALLMAGEQSNPGKWTADFKEKYCQAYSHVRDVAIAHGDSAADAHKAGVHAAYLIYRSDEHGEQDPGDQRKAKKKIASFLEQQGYSNS